MTEREKMKAVERLVREVLSVDLHQKVSQDVVRDVAEKVSKAIPTFRQKTPRQLARP